MDVSILIRLIDEFSRPASKLRDGLKKLGATANTVKRELGNAFRTGFSVENIEQASRNAEQALTRAKGRLMGAVGMGLALAAPIKSLGDFEDRLVSFGNVAGIFDEDLARIGAALREIGPQVNKNATEMLTALEYLVGKGIDPDTALEALKSVGMTATATKSDIEEMAASGFAVIDNLSVPAERLQAAFDAMAQSGKAGGFELKGMAAYFPQLTASARALNMEGVPAVAELSAALQIAMKGAGNEGIAANNLQNFLSKLTSRETTKNFEKLGVNLEAEFEKAAEKGVSVFEHMIELISEVTEGGDQFKLQKIFSDQQVLNFLKPMLANLEEYKSIRDAAMSADGVNLGDFERNTQTFIGLVKGLTIEVKNLTAAGGPLLEVAKQITVELIGMVSVLNSFSTANPELTSNLVLATAGLAAFGIAARLVGWIVAAIRVPLVGLAKTFFMFNEAGVNVAKGWRALAIAGQVAAWVFRLAAVAAGAAGTAIAGITAPIWALVAAIVAAVAAIAFAVWKYWDRISSFTAGFVAPIKEALADVAAAMGSAADSVLSAFAKVTGLDGEAVKAFFVRTFDVSLIVEKFRSQIDTVFTWLSGLFTQEKLSDSGKAEMAEAGRRLGQALVDGIKAGAEAIWAWFSHWPTMIIQSIGTIDLSKLLHWGQPPSWLKWVPGLGGGNDAPAMAPLGGPGKGLAQETKTTIAASVTDDRPPNVTVNAPITVSGTSTPGAVAQEVKSKLGAAVSSARNGALHGGAD